MIHEEFELQKKVCQYLESEYPDVLFLSDTIASLKLTQSQAKRNKSIQKKGFRCTDLIILEPNKQYKGLFIELKVDSPYKKNGELKKQLKKRPTFVKGSKIPTYIEYDHLQEQQNSINKLLQKGYFACFSWGFDMTKIYIDNYLNQDLK